MLWFQLRHCQSFHSPTPPTYPNDQTANSMSSLWHGFTRQGPESAQTSQVFYSALSNVPARTYSGYNLSTKITNAEDLPVPYLPKQVRRSQGFMAHGSRLNHWAQPKMRPQQQRHDSQYSTESGPLLTIVKKRGSRRRFPP